jgi:hypothetical protein
LGSCSGRRGCACEIVHRFSRFYLAEVYRRDEADALRRCDRRLTLCAEHTSGCFVNYDPGWGTAEDPGGPPLPRATRDAIDGHLNGRLGHIYFYSRIQVDAQGIIGVGHNRSIRGFRPQPQHRGVRVLPRQFAEHDQAKYYKPTFPTGLRSMPAHAEK